MLTPIIDPLIKSNDLIMNLIKFKGLIKEVTPFKIRLITKYIKKREIPISSPLFLILYPL
jgi:hypothetical protein